MKIYAFIYKSCIWGDTARTISLHKTPEGAQKALEIHKAFQEKEHNEIGMSQHFKFDEDKYWGVQEFNLLD